MASKSNSKKWGGVMTDKYARTSADADRATPMGKGSPKWTAPTYSREQKVAIGKAVRNGSLDTERACEIYEVTQQQVASYTQMARRAEFAKDEEAKLDSYLGQKQGQKKLYEAAHPELVDATPQAMKTQTVITGGDLSVEVIVAQPGAETLHWIWDVNRTNLNIDYQTGFVTVAFSIRGKDELSSPTP